MSEPTKKSTKKPSARALSRKLRAVERERDELRARLDAEPDFDDLMRRARRWHYTEVTSVVDDALARLGWERLVTRMTATEARDWLTTDVEQTTDGHQHVIYTGMAGMLLAASTNDDAAHDVVDDGVPLSTSVRALYALRADVWQELDVMRSDEWDFDDDPVWVPLP